MLFERLANVEYKILLTRLAFYRENHILAQLKLLWVPFALYSTNALLYVDPSSQSQFAQKSCNAKRNSNKMNNAEAQKGLWFMYVALASWYCCCCHKESDERVLTNKTFFFWGWNRVVVSNIIYHWAVWGWNFWRLGWIKFILIYSELKCG